MVSELILLPFKKGGELFNHFEQFDENTQSQANLKEGNREQMENNGWSLSLSHISLGYKEEEEERSKVWSVFCMRR